MVTTSIDINACDQTHKIIYLNTEKLKQWKSSLPSNTKAHRIIHLNIKAHNNDNRKWSRHSNKNSHNKIGSRALIFTQRSQNEWITSRWFRANDQGPRRWHSSRHLFVGVRVHAHCTGGSHTPGHGLAWPERAFKHLLYPPPIDRPSITACIRHVAVGKYLQL